MDTHESSNPATGYRTGRMEAFSDGVFAIAITLLVLEISVPAGSEDDLIGALGDLVGALGDQWASYLALALFIMVPFGAFRHRSSG